MARSTAQLIASKDNVRGARIVWFPDGTVEKRGHYCLMNGCYADVWEGRLNGHAVAVKVWRGASLDNELRRDFLGRLTNELRIWGTLSHPNVVPFHGLVTDFGHLPSLVLPYYRNGTVVEYVQANPSVRVIDLLLNIASALSYLHNLPTPVVHGDIKGSNIFVTDDGQACLCDFGQNAIIADSTFTTANVAGSCRWMAPEIMNPTEPMYWENTPVPFTPQSDVHSFGMAALEIYTGKKPFSHRRNDSAVIFEIVRGGRPPRPAQGGCPQLTDAVWAVLESCWGEVPHARPNMDAVGFWLRTVVQLQL